MGAPNASARGVAFVRGLGGGAHRCGGWCSGRRCAQIRVVRCAGVWWNARVCCSPPFLYDAGPCATDAARVESSGRRAHAVGRRRPAVWHRMLFDEPVAVRVTRRNYGDGWVRAEHVELRNAVSLPAWTRVPQPIRRAMARARCSEQ